MDRCIGLVRKKRDDRPTWRSKCQDALVEPGVSARSHARHDTVDSPSLVRGRAGVVARHSRLAPLIANPKSNGIPLPARRVQSRVFGKVPSIATALRHAAARM